MRAWLPITVCGFCFVGPITAIGQTAQQSDLPLKDFLPRPMLVVNETDIAHAKYPVVDVHTHFSSRLNGTAEQLRDFVEVMDRNRIAVCVSLDAVLGNVEDHSRFLFRDYPDRFVFFVRVDWRGNGDEEDPATWDCHRPDFAHRAVEQLREAKHLGASGVKLTKQFGLGYRNPDGSLMKIDDPRWDPIWAACGELGLPVIIHAADPAAFFLPIDRTNERFEELSRRPEWSFFGQDFPSRNELLRARNRVIERHRGTDFIGAHVANNAEDLAQVGKWLDEYPNLYIEIASRISELGRQPYTARDFLIKYQDRVLFGTDGPWPELRLKYYFRFLETRDEYFPYSEKPFPPQGLWRIYGVHLPEVTLRKIYFDNACQMIPGVRDRYARTVEKWAADDR